MLINLTPHRIIFPNNRIIESAGSARCELSEQSEWVDGVHSRFRTYGEVHGLPDCEDGKFYIVSNVVRWALPERYDLCSPYRINRNPKDGLMYAEGLIFNTPNERNLKNE